MIFTSVQNFCDVKFQNLVKTQTDCIAHVVVLNVGRLLSWEKIIRTKPVIDNKTIRAS